MSEGRFNPKMSRRSLLKWGAVAGAAMSNVFSAFARDDNQPQPGKTASEAVATNENFQLSDAHKIFIGQYEILITELGAEITVDDKGNVWFEDTWDQNPENPTFFVPKLADIKVFLHNNHIQFTEEQALNVWDYFSTMRQLVLLNFCHGHQKYPNDNAYLSIDQLGNNTSLVGFSFDLSRLVQSQAPISDVFRDFMNKILSPDQEITTTKEISIISEAVAIPVEAELNGRAPNLKDSVPSTTPAVLRTFKFLGQEATIADSGKKYLGYVQNLALEKFPARLGRPLNTGETWQEIKAQDEDFDLHCANISEEIVRETMNKFVQLINSNKADFNLPADQNFEIMNWTQPPAGADEAKILLWNLGQFMNNMTRNSISVHVLRDEVNMYDPASRETLFYRVFAEHFFLPEFPSIDRLGFLKLIHSAIKSTVTPGAPAFLSPEHVIQNVFSEIETPKPLGPMFDHPEIFEPTVKALASSYQVENVIDRIKIIDADIVLMINTIHLNPLWAGSIGPNLGGTLAHEMGHGLDSNRLLKRILNGQVNMMSAIGKELLLAKALYLARANEDALQDLDAFGQIDALPDPEAVLRSLITKEPALLKLLGNNYLTRTTFEICTVIRKALLEGQLGNVSNLNQLSSLVHEIYAHNFYERKHRYLGARSIMDKLKQASGPMRIYLRTALPTDMSFLSDADVEKLTLREKLSLISHYLWYIQFKSNSNPMDYLNLRTNLVKNDLGELIHNLAEEVQRISKAELTEWTTENTFEPLSVDLLGSLMVLISNPSGDPALQKLNDDRYNPETYLILLKEIYNLLEGETSGKYTSTSLANYFNQLGKCIRQSVPEDKLDVEKFIEQLRGPLAQTIRNWAQLQLPDIDDTDKLMTYVNRYLSELKQAILH